jgi:hypothetical protein
MVVRMSKKWFHEQQAKVQHLKIDLQNSKSSRQQLEGIIAEERDAAKKIVASLTERNKQLTGQVGDLKERLHKAEIENERLRGYLERVLEDDVVNEDLIKVGEPGGEERLVPKRKSTILHRVPVMTSFDLDADVHDSRPGIMTWQDKTKRPRHWIRYGESE